MKKRIQKKLQKQKDVNQEYIPIVNSPIKPLKPGRKEGLQTNKSKVVHARDYYVKAVGKIFKFHTTKELLQTKLEQLNIDSEAIVSKGSKLFYKYKELYNAQNRPTIVKKVKKFIFKALDAITPEKTQFKKGENQTLTKRGEVQKEAQWKYVQVTDSTGLVHLKRVPKTLVLTEESTIDYRINQKDDEGNRISRLKTRIEPPKPKGNAEKKARLQQEKRFKSVHKIRETRDKLRAKRKAKNKTLKGRLSTVRGCTRVYKPISENMKVRRAEIKQKWQEKEFKLANYLRVKDGKKAFKKLENYQKSKKRKQMLRDLYYTKKRDKYLQKMKENGAK